MAVLKFLGTSASIPSAQRDNTSFFFSYNKTSFLIDCPGSISHKLLKAGEDYKKIKQVIITHHHPDHIYGIISLIHTQAYLNDRLNIFSTTSSIKIIKQLVKIFKLDRPGYPIIKYTDVLEKNYFFSNKGLKIKAVKNAHIKDSFGLYFKFGEKTLGYSSDTSFSKKLLKNFGDADYIIHDCTASSLYFKKYPQLFKMHTCSLQLADYFKDKPKTILIPIHFLLRDKKEKYRIKKELSPLKKVIFVEDYQKIILKEG